jgi:hypothetical protein
LGDGTPPVAQLQLDCDQPRKWIDGIYGSGVSHLVPDSDDLQLATVQQRLDNPALKGTPAMWSPDTKFGLVNGLLSEFQQAAGQRVGEGRAGRQKLARRAAGHQVGNTAASVYFIPNPKHPRLLM